MHGSDPTRGEHRHADLPQRQAIAKRWLGLLVEERPVESLEGLSIGQLNRLVRDLARRNKRSALGGRQQHQTDR